MANEMYFGHYGIGLALKRFTKGISLGWLFLAVQFVDILAATLMILGIEKGKCCPLRAHLFPINQEMFWFMALELFIPV